MKILVKVFKNGASKVCGRQTISLQTFKGCFPQILLGPFLNTLTHIFNILQMIMLYLIFRRMINGKRNGWIFRIICQMLSGWQIIIRISSFPVFVIVSDKVSILLLFIFVAQGNDFMQYNWVNLISSTEALKDFCFL